MTDIFFSSWVGGAVRWVIATLKRQASQSVIRHASHNRLLWEVTQKSDRADTGESMNSALIGRQRQQANSFNERVSMGFATVFGMQPRKILAPGIHLEYFLLNNSWITAPSHLLVYWLRSFHNHQRSIERGSGLACRRYNRSFWLPRAPPASGHLGYLTQLPPYLRRDGWALVLVILGLLLMRLLDAISSTVHADRD